jgi:hypothetical protein
MLVCERRLRHHWHKFPPLDKDGTGADANRSTKVRAALFRIDHDPQTHLLRISISGFLTPEDVPAVATAIDAKARETVAISNDFNVIVESLDFPVQASGVADLLTGIMQRGMAKTSGHAAIVVGSYLNKLQAERTLVHPRLRVFPSVEAAETWLADIG